MKPSDVFGICVRVIGLFGFLVGIAYIILGLCMVLWGKSGYDGFQTGQYLVYGVFFGAIGLYFLRGAPQFARFAYPTEKKEKSSNH
jgi:hypothetical protein